jgi:PIN domain nuclease of toxin-antitoxin system
VLSIEKNQPVCLDTTAVIAYISNEEPSASLVALLVDHADLEVIISTLTLSEVVTRPARANDHHRVQIIIKSLEALPRFRVITFDRSHAIDTAIVRGTTGLRLPDAAIVATARLANAIALIGNNKQWRHKSLGVPYHHLDDLLAHP